LRRLQNTDQGQGDPEKGDCAQKRTILEVDVSLNLSKIQSGKADLVSILDEVIKLVASPENDFLWSSWMGPEEAISELANYRAEIARDDFRHLATLDILLAPTGSLQELSISGGWSQAFLELSAKYDRIAAVLKQANI
jgi:hypothetical protein